MQQLLSVWNALSLRQRIVVVGATIGVTLAVLAMARVASQPSMSLLYAGLESGAAGEVVQSLQARGIPYEVRGGAIFVPEEERDSLRLTLASEGLPANGNRGYELLDSLSGFGTTSQMFDAAYWRAKEGELARTIVANPDIATARVHIANSSSNPFQRDVKPTASISVSTTGAMLSPQQARALQYLVASAVPGMTPDDVAVIDGQGGLVATDGSNAPTGPTAEDTATRMRDRVQRLMEARVGVGNAVVEVSVDTVTETESIRERLVDPESRVAISVDTEERTDQSRDSGGDVTVASNLPDGEAEGDGTSSSQSAETRERVNYEVSETMREITRGPGSIRRVTVAVLVNGTYTTGETGAPVFQPLPQQELDALRALVASAVGYDETRGDEITLQSLPFERPEGLGTGPVEPGFLSGAFDLMRLIQMGILALVALLLGLFVVRPILARDEIAGPSAAGALPAPAGGGAPAMDGELDSPVDFDNLPVLSDGPDFGGMGMVDFDTDGALPSEDPVDRLRALIEERKTETVEILRSWLDDKEEVK